MQQLRLTIKGVGFITPALAPVVKTVRIAVDSTVVGMDCPMGDHPRLWDEFHPVARLLVSGVDLLTDADKRPEARQLLYSLEKYMGSAAFKPAQSIDVSRLQNLFN